MSIYVLLYRFCQLFLFLLFPTLNSIFLFKRAREKTHQESKHGLWLSHNISTPWNSTCSCIWFGFCLHLKLSSWQRQTWSWLVKNLSPLLNFAHLPAFKSQKSQSDVQRQHSVAPSSLPSPFICTVYTPLSLSMHINSPPCLVFLLYWHGSMIDIVHCPHQNEQTWNDTRKTPLSNISN